MPRVFTTKRHRLRLESDLAEQMKARLVENGGLGRSTPYIIGSRRQFRQRTLGPAQYRAIVFRSIRSHVFMEAFPEEAARGGDQIMHVGCSWDLRSTTFFVRHGQSSRKV
jgi:hypothetical protein